MSRPPLEEEGFTTFGGRKECYPRRSLPISRSVRHLQERGKKGRPPTMERKKNSKSSLEKNFFLEGAKKLGLKTSWKKREKEGHVPSKVKKKNCPPG